MASGRSLGKAQRKRLRFKHWMSRLWLICKCGGALGLGGVLIWGGYQGVELVRGADYFRVRTIDISGHVALSREEMLYLLAVPEDVSLLELDLMRMGARLERHPQIEQVTLRRHYPDTLKVGVHERVPRLTVVSGTQRVVVDREGVVLRPVSKTKDDGLTQLHLHKKPALSPGMRLRQGEVQRALELLQAYEGSEVASSLRLVALTVEETGASSWTVDPYRFTLQVGEGGVEEQLKRLPPVLRYLRHHDLGVKLVDVSYRKRVVVIPES